MVMNSLRSLTMSSISALKVALVSKRESRVLIGILLSFVFCFSSLKINVKADSDTSDIAWLFFGGMGFTGDVYQSVSVMNNTNQGGSLNTNSVYLYPTTGDPVHVVYYYISGQMYPTVVDSGNTQNNGLVNANLINITFSGSTRFRLKYTSGATILPVYVGNYSSMPDDIRSLIQGENINGRLQYLISIEEASKNKLDNIFTRLGDSNTYLNTIGSNTGITNNKLDTTNTKLDTTNSHLSVISGYLQSNNQQTNNNVSSNISQKNTFDTKANTLATFESSQGTDLDTNLQSLNISSSTGLLVNSSFVKSALWVNDMFDRLIVGSPFELVLVFCLSIGIAFAMIGKVR